MDSRQSVQRVSVSLDPSGSDGGTLVCTDSELVYRSNEQTHNIRIPYPSITSTSTRTRHDSEEFKRIGDIFLIFSFFAVFLSGAQLLGAIEMGRFAQYSLYGSTVLAFPTTLYMYRLDNGVSHFLSVATVDDRHLFYTRNGLDELNELADYLVAQSECASDGPTGEATWASRSPDNAPTDTTHRRESPISDSARLADARDARAKGDYERAIAIYEDIYDQYQNWREHTETDISRFEHTIARLEREIEITRQLERELPSIRDDLETVDAAFESRTVDDARTLLADIGPRLRSIRSVSNDRDLAGVLDTIVSLEQRYTDSLHTVALMERRQTLIKDLDSVESVLSSESDATLRRKYRRFAGLNYYLDDLRLEAASYGFDELVERTERLDDRCSRCLTETIELLKTRWIPDTAVGEPNHQLNYDSFEITDTIGHGGNADVSKVTVADGSVESALAVKQPRIAGTLHTDAVERMLAEAERWDKLDDHDHIVDVVDWGGDPMPWIAMEYMDGGHLGARAGSLSCDEALWTAIGITKGVYHAHRHGVAHLDLKPENVLFRVVESAWDVPKVADWGLSKQLLDHTQSVHGFTPQYAAPEQFDAEYGPTDDITDIYQLGAVLYELFTGQPPFEGQPSEVMHQVFDGSAEPPSKVASVPSAVDDIVLTAMEPERADRYESALLVRDDLQDAYDEFWCEP